MKTIATIAFATCALTGFARAAGDMPSMNMKMTLPPMPAIYAGTPDKPGAPLFDGYGDHTHKVTTANPRTQAYFDQGVRLLFGFNHAEAIRSFREAARLVARHSDGIVLQVPPCCQRSCLLVADALQRPESFYRRILRER